MYELIPLQSETEYISHPEQCRACHSEHGALLSPRQFRKLYYEPLCDKDLDWGGLPCVGRKITFGGDIPVYESLAGYMNIYALPTLTSTGGHLFRLFLDDPLLQNYSTELLRYYELPKTLLTGTYRLEHYRHDYKRGLCFPETLPNTQHVLWMHPYLVLTYASILACLAKESKDLWLIQNMMSQEIVREYQYFLIDSDVQKVWVFEFLRYAPFFQSSSPSPISRTYVYLVRRGDSRIFKIGMSTDPFTRLKGLQIGNAELLHLVQAWEVQHASHVETQLHHMFEAVRMQGEWFALSVDQEADLIIFMKQYQEQSHE